MDREAALGDLTDRDDLTRTTAPGSTNAGPVRTLDRLVATAPSVEGVWAKDVRPGDWIVVRTRNSVYSMSALGDGSYAAAGGWLTAAGIVDPIRVAGCTWGGFAIHTGIVAAPGMFLEFENGVRTTRIREVRLFRGGDGSAH